MRSVNRTIYLLSFLLFSFLSLPTKVAYSQVAATFVTELLNGNTNNLIISAGGYVPVDIQVDEVRSTGEKVFVYSTGYDGSSNKFLTGEAYSPNLNSPYYICSAGDALTDVSYQNLVVNQQNGHGYVAYASNYITANGYDIFLCDNTPPSEYYQRMNLNLPGNQIAPKMVIDYNRKELIIAWTDQNGNDGSGSGIYCRRVDYTKLGTGNEFIGGDVKLNTTTTDHQILTDLDIDPVTGDIYMTANYSSGAGGYFYDVYYKKFSRNTDNTLNTASSEVLVNSGFTSNDQFDGKLTINHLTGSYTIAWTDLGNDGDGYGAYAKIYSKTGSVLKSDFRVNSGIIDSQRSPQGIWDDKTGSILYLYHNYNPSTVSVKMRTVDEDFNLSSSDGTVLIAPGPYSGPYFQCAYNQTSQKLFLAYDKYSTIGSIGSNGWFTQIRYTPPSPGMPALDNSQNNTQSLSINEPITSPSQLNTLKTKDYTITREYMDGFGRTTQMVTCKGSPNKKDIVQPIMYDQYGRVTKTFLPYAASDANGTFRTKGTWYGTSGSDGALAAFYNASGDKVVNDTKPFTTSNFESSPLNRFVSQTPTGNDWQTKPITHTERPNTLSDNVLKWTYNFSGGTATATVGGYYAAGTLTVTITGDEDGKQTMTFKTFKGEEVLKKLSGAIVTETYQVFDIYGKLRYVFPPEATKYINTYNTTPGATIAIEYEEQFFTNRFAYAYLYDKKGRQVEKKLPGKPAEFTIYDKLDRVVLTQDPKQRAANQWSFTKYDALNRPVYAGLYNPGSLITRSAMQTNVDGDAVVNEVRSSGGTHGYSSVAYPTSTSLTEVLTVNYYDDYNFNYDAGGTADYSYSNTGGPVGQEASAMANTLGTATGSKVKILGTTSDFLIKASFYDKYGRPIQVKGNNALNLSSVADVTTNVYDFSGKLTASREVHVPANGQATISIDNWFEYDHADRVTNTWQQNSRTLSGTTTTDAKVLFSQVKYNDLGEVVEKNLHSENQGATALQSVDYTYNIRGWKTHINSSNLDASSTSNNDDSNDLFGMELLYQNTTAGVTTTQQYNGSISAMLWKTNTPAASPLKAYVYSYDNLDRLTDATYKEYSGGAWSSTNKLREAIPGYDLNGNIKFLQRWNGSAQQIDNLTYSYVTIYSTANKLTTVTDAATTVGGFRDFANSDSEISYDANGNMTFDGNARSFITYNHLNLPTSIQLNGGKNIYYIYDALGNKLKKYITFGGCQGTTHFIDGFVYTSTDCNAATPTGVAFQYFSTTEGRVTNNGNNFSYEYILKDHLGNSRVMFDKEPSTGLARALQEDNYYAFGLKHGPSQVWSGSSTGANKYLYNSKEILEESDGSGLAQYYEYGARMYDPILARWVVIDERAEDYYSFSPYAYVNNDPVGLTDPDGRGFWSKVKNAAKSVASATVKIAKIAAPIVAGIVVGAIVTAAILGSGGLAAAPLGMALLAGAASGAAGAAASNISSQVIANKGFKNFNLKSLAKDVIVGGITGALSAGAAKGVQRLKDARRFKELKSFGDINKVEPKGLMQNVSDKRYITRDLLANNSTEPPWWGMPSDQGAKNLMWKYTGIDPNKVVDNTNKFLNSIGPAPSKIPAWEQLGEDILDEVLIRGAEKLPSFKWRFPFPFFIPPGFFPDKPSSFLGK